MRTKVLFGAIVVAVLAVFGALGLQQTKDTEAAWISGISGCNGTIVVSGNTCDFTVSFFDDNGTTAINASAGGQVLSSVATTCSLATINGNGTPSITLFDAGTNVTANPGPGCDTDAPSQAYTWTIRITASCPTASLNIPITVTAPATAGVGGPAGGAGTGSMSPGLPGNQTGALGTSTVGLVCTPATCLALTARPITIRKVDQFGQPLAASFSIQQGPFWVEVVRVNLFRLWLRTPAPRTVPRARSTSPALAASCANVGVISPAVLTRAACRPVSTASLRSLAPTATAPSSRSTTATRARTSLARCPSAAALLTQPVTVNLPDANPLDLQLTFVNSCIVPGGPSTATSQIAVVIGGSTPGLVNTSNIEISPAPGSDDDARLDIRIRDTASITIPNAHVTVLIDKGALALRRDLSSYPAPQLVATTRSSPVGTRTSLRRSLATPVTSPTTAGGSSPPLRVATRGPS